MVICTRPGCGADFDPSASAAGPCKHHPGAPVFHEGSKSWSCCRDHNKPVLEFDEFMLIEGCTTEDAHTDVKQTKTSFAKSTATGSDDSAADRVAAKGDRPTANDAAAAPPAPMSATRLAAVQQQQEKKKGGVSPNKEDAAARVEEQDPAWADESGKVDEGATCKRAGCKVTATGKRKRSEESCAYHPGVAIFHEGSKGYACCRRRVLEFDEFLTIEGCTKAASGHLFVGGAAPAAANGAARIAKPLDADSPVQDEAEATCRIDHYETPNDVRVTVYAKGVEMDRSRIAVKADSVDFSLALPALPTAPNVLRRFNRILLPFAAIDEQASTFTVTRFKVDLVLVKQRRGESWPALERTDKALGYGVTFGRKLDA